MPLQSPEYLELLTLTQLHLLQEYSPSDWISSDSSTTDFFRAYARLLKPPRETQTAMPNSPVNKIPSSKKEVEAEQATPTYKDEKKGPITLLKEGSASLPQEIKTEIAVQTKANASQNEKSDKKEPTAKFQLDHLKPSSASVEFSDLRAIIVERFPHQKIIDNLPERKNRNALPEVVLLASMHSLQEMEFLEAVANAIRNQLCSASVFAFESLDHSHFLDNAMQSPTLKLLISRRMLLEQFPSSLEKIPRLLLRETSEYLNDPALKKELWHSIRKLIII